MSGKLTSSLNWHLLIGSFELRDVIDLDDSMDVKVELSRVGIDGDKPVCLMFLYSVMVYVFRIVMFNVMINMCVFDKCIWN